MARGEIFTAKVDGIAAGGAGLARFDGKIIFIDLTAPGDLVRCRIKKEHKNWAEGELLEVVEPSSNRVEPVCPFYGRCGGCSLQHLNLEAQLKAKSAILCDSLARIGGIVPPEIRLRTGEPFEYRNRVRLHSMDDHQFGFRERKSSRIVPLNDCPIAEANIRKALKDADLAPHPPRESFTVFSFLDTFLFEGGMERGNVSILGKKLTMDAGVFFQSNVAMLELLIGDLAAISNTANRELPMADVYCGVGTFSFFLAHKFPMADLVEENKAALALAGQNMHGKKANYLALTDTEWVRTLKIIGREKVNKSWGFMILDPPRDGISRPLCEWLAQNGPDLAAYVSCNPAALARDSRILSNGGYSLRDLYMYDFYPQTAHIESLAVFYRDHKTRSNNPGRTL